MHICHIVKDNVGGAPKVADFLISAHVAAGHQVSVIALKDFDPQWNLYGAASEIHILKTTSNLGAIQALREKLLGFRPDILICHSTFVTRTAFLSRCLQRAASLPPLISYVHSDLVLEICGTRRETYFKQFCRSLLAKLFIKISLISLERSNGVVFVCKDLYKRHQQIGLKQDQVLISYNPPLSNSADQTINSKADSWFNQSELVPFVCAARLDSQKDHKTLFYAFAKAKRAASNIRLILLGDGSLKSELQQLAESLNIDQSLLFLGVVHNPKVYFSHARAIILASHWEGLPLVLVEAVSSNTTFIASDCPVGPRELSEVLGCGTIVPPQDIDALAKAILDHAKTPKPVLEKSVELQAFTESACVDRLNQFIDTIVAI